MRLEIESVRRALDEHETILGTVATAEAKRAEYAAQAHEDLPLSLVPRISAAPRPIRVLIAAGEALVRASYRLLLERDERIEVVGEAAADGQAMALTDTASPDVALLDMGLPGLEDLGALASIVSRLAGGCAALMLVGADENDDRVLCAVQAGATGILSTDAEPGRLVHGIRVLAGGDALLPGAVVRRLVARLPPGRLIRPPGELAKLTDREREVVALVATGLSNGEIAAQLVISPATVKTHVNRAMVKVHVRDRAQLVVLVYDGGLVPARRSRFRALRVADC